MSRILNCRPLLRFAVRDRGVSIVITTQPHLLTSRLLLALSSGLEAPPAVSLLHNDWSLLPSYLCRHEQVPADEEAAGGSQ